jgi:hypothetical protein
VELGYSVPGIVKIQLDNKQLNGGVSRTLLELCWSIWNSNIWMEAWTLNVCCSGLGLEQGLDGCQRGVITSSDWTINPPKLHISSLPPVYQTVYLSITMSSPSVSPSSSNNTMVPPLRVVSS